MAEPVVVIFRLDDTLVRVLNASQAQIGKEAHFAVTARIGPENPQTI